MIRRPVACADTTFGPATPRNPERATNTKSETPAGDSLNAIRPGQGRSVKSPTRDRTTVKCRRLSVAMSRMPSRSAVAITEAVPSGRLRQAATSSAIRIQSLAATCSARRLHPHWRFDRPASGGTRRLLRQFRRSRRAVPACGGVRRDARRQRPLTVSQRAPTPQGYAGVSTRKRYQRSMMSSLFADTMLNHGDCCS